MPNTTMRKPRDWFFIYSWVFLILVFAALVIYLLVHVEDLLDADMASELILAQQLKIDIGLLSGNWHYSTEIRVLNTQLVYSLFFHAFEDWQTVRILGNVTLYLLLLGSYYFLSKKLRIARYFPFSAGILLLPLSAPYFYIFLYGAYYIPRVCMMFVILGILMQAPSEHRSKTCVIVSTMIACLLSLALGLEGARMLLVIFVPLAIVAGAELLWCIVSRDRRANSQRGSLLRKTGFPLYLAQAFLVCVFALAGFLINQKVLIFVYPFEQYETMIPNLTFGGIKRTLYDQLHLIGYGTLKYVISAAVWTAVGVLIAWFLLRKGEKSASTLRFLWACVVSWASYSAFCSLIYFGQVVWHMSPVAVLFVPAVSLVLNQLQQRPILQRLLCIGLSLCLLLIGIQGYFRFESWPGRNATRTNEAFQQIATILKEKEYRNGYATFWNANVLTELSDGAIDVWCVEHFDAQTTQQPHIYQWLQTKTHETTLPTGKVFLVWTAAEYAAYDKLSFTYLGDILFRNDAFVVYEVIP